MAPVEGYPIGLARVLLFVYPNTGNQAGVFTGTQRTLSNGSVSAAYVLSNCKTAGLNYSPTTDLQIQGGDRIVSTPSFSNPRLLPFDIVASSVDSVLSTLLNSGATNSTNSYFSKYGYNPNNVIPFAVGVVVEQRFETVTGFQFWKNRIIPKATGSYHPGQATWRAESDSTLHISPTTSPTTYTGQTYDTNGLNFQWDQDRGDYYDLDSNDPIYIIAARGPVSTISLPYRPLDTIVATPNTPNEMYFVDTNGSVTLTALGSISTGAGASATLGTALGTASMAVLTYTTNFVAS